MAGNPAPCPNCGHRKGEQATSTVHVNIQGGDPVQLGRAIRQAVLDLKRRYGPGY